LGERRKLWIDTGAEETACVKNPEWGKASELLDRTKRDFSAAQTDTFAGAKVEEKASACFGRNGKFAEGLATGTTVTAGTFLRLFAYYRADRR